MSEFWELYKRPEWQQKRLEVLNRFNWKCCYCGTKDSELHVHHAFYEPDKKPWEYPDEGLTALCKKCHVRAEEYRVKIRSLLCLLGYTHREEIVGFLQGLKASQPWTRERFVPIEAYEEATGFAAWWAISPEQVLEMVSEDGQLDTDLLPPWADEHVKIRHAYQGRRRKQFDEGLLSAVV